MRAFSAFFLISLALSAMPARADCQRELSAVIDAMRAAGPVRQESVAYKNGVVIEKMVMELNPPEQMQRTIEMVGQKMVQTMLVSGKQAWVINKQQGQSDQPTMEIDGAENIIKDATKFDLPYWQVTECMTNGTGELFLTWKGEDKSKSIQFVAHADAKTHLLKSTNSITTLKDVSEKYERKASFTSIAAFTVTSPVNSIPDPNRPKYAKISDVDPAIPMPPDAEKISYSKEGRSVRFSSMQKVAELAEFYRSKYKAMGWVEERARSRGTSLDTFFRNGQKDWVNLQLEAGDQVTKVRVNGPYPEK